MEDALQLKELLLMIGSKIPLIVDYFEGRGIHPLRNLERSSIEKVFVGGPEALDEEHL